MGGNSLGGVVACVARGVPPGLGEPVFDKLDAELAGAVPMVEAMVCLVLADHLLRQQTTRLQGAT